MRYATMYIRAAQQQGTIIHRAHEPVTERADRPESQLDVPLFEDNVERTRHYSEGDQEVADEYQDA